MVVELGERRRRECVEGGLRAQGGGRGRAVGGGGAVGGTEGMVVAGGGEWMGWGGIE